MRIIRIILLWTICFLSSIGRYFIINILSERQVVVIFFRGTVCRRYLPVNLAARSSLKYGWGNTARALKPWPCVRQKLFISLPCLINKRPFFQFLTLFCFVSYIELSVLWKLTSDKILKKKNLVPYLYAVHCQSLFKTCKPKNCTLSSGIQLTQF